MSENNRPRCECCDEVLEELLTMRQNFEKLCQRLGNQIVELRREVCSLAAAASSSNHKNNCGGEQIGKKSKPRRESRSNSPEYSPPRKTTRRQLGESPTEFDIGSKITKIKILRVDSIKQEATVSTSPATTASLAVAVAKSQARARRPVLEFFGIQARVMPTRPFVKSAEFEDWEALLQSDEDQRDRLRVELLQENAVSPDNFIKQTWRSILSDEATMHYTYHGNAKTTKKPIKNYIFTGIFQEVFMQLFKRLDSSYFIERTMRYFNYCHDRARRVKRLNQPRNMENMEQTIQFETTNVDDQTQSNDSENKTFAESFTE